MRIKCPACQHEFDAPTAVQRAGGKARWKKVSSKARSEAMRKAVQARWATNRRQKK
jgi:hypothetical protein